MTSLSKPHINHDNGTRARKNDIYLSIYLCIIYPVFVAPWFLRSCPEMLRVFWYINVLTCVIYNCRLTARTTGATCVRRD